MLNTPMSGFGGFEHNRQRLRIVDLLEHPYPDFAGLNLMYETRLGFARHQSPYDRSAVDDFDESNCSLEGQIETWLTELYEKLCTKPDLMPQHYQHLISGEGLERTVCDYIAGMTDRFCISILREI